MSSSGSWAIGSAIPLQVLERPGWMVLRPPQLLDSMILSSYLIAYVYCIFTFL